MNTAIRCLRKIKNRFVKPGLANGLSTRDDSNLQDLSIEEASTIDKVRDFTMCSTERLISLIRATRHISENDINGSIVECGVWRGGCMMSVAYTLNKLGDSSRQLYLFDTFDGMTPPTEEDGIAADNQKLEDLLERFETEEKNPESHFWAYCPKVQVEENLIKTGYQKNHLHFVAGRVEDTIPATETGDIALLRLDTDWYQSTLHELKHLYPRLVVGGILIIDDYGFSLGAKKAVDEYFANFKRAPFMHRIDFTGRLLIKT